MWYKKVWKKRIFCPVLHTIKEGDTIIAQQLQMRNLPDLMTLKSGKPLTPKTREMRKAQLMDSLSKKLYGYTPDAGQLFSDVLCPGKTGSAL